MQANFPGGECLGELQAPPEARHQQRPVALCEQLATILICSPNERYKVL